MLKVFTMDDINLTVAGTRQQVSATSIRCTTVIFSAKKANLGKLYIGDSSVSATRGVELEAGESVAFTADQNGRDGDEFDLSDFWFDGGTTGDDLGVAYVKNK